MTKPPRIDKSALAISTGFVFRDGRWDKKLREMPCIMTGAETHDGETVDPAHVSIAGRSIKNHSPYQVPLVHSLHDLQTNHGWARMFKTLPEETQESALKNILKLAGSMLWVMDRLGASSPIDAIMKLRKL